MWLIKGNQYEFRQHPNIKWSDGGLEPQSLDFWFIALPLELI